jgi:hypothetical protein
MKQYKIGYAFAFFILIFLLPAFVPTDDFVLTQNELVTFTTKKINQPTLKPLQMDCCRTGQYIPSAYGARCTSGNSPCVANPCPEGTSECGNK